MILSGVIGGGGGGEDWRAVNFSGRVARLKLFKRSRGDWTRFALAIGAGLLLAAAFPKWRLSGFAWVAPGLILAAAFETDGGRIFRIGWLAGLAHHLATLYWLLMIPFPLAPILGWLALSGYLALFIGAWAWLCWRLFPGSPAGGAADQGMSRIIEAFTAATFFQRQAWCLWCATVWVAMEMIRGRFLSGFPWNFAGVSQFQNLPVIQIAAVAGVCGVSFLVVWFSAALLSTGVMMAGNPAKSRQWRMELLVPLLAVVAVALHGIRVLGGRPAPDRTLALALVQPSIPQKLIWNPGESGNRFQQLLRLSEKALASEPKPALIVWPEAAVPNLLRYEREIYQAVTNLVVTNRVWMIAGADDAEPRAGSGGGRDYDYFNSAFLITPDGELKSSYRKRRLVVFGEYTPLARWIPILRNLLPAGEGFQAGDRSVPFRIPALDVTTSVLICFEDTFPHLARGDAGEDVDFLLNLTNNGWFGESAAQWQHAATSAFRAVENGLPLVRCANNGLTCWVDATGAMREIFTSGGSENVYDAGFQIVHIPLRAPGTPRERTFYGRHGDWFGWGCVGVTAGVIALTWQKRRKATPPASPGNSR
jgi:apolipoprotein N-acyltransferase